MKKTLVLLFTIVCSQHMTGEFKDINVNGLTPGKQILLEEKIREIKALETELAHYGSEYPAITNTRLGMMGMVGGAATLIAGTLLENKEMVNAGLNILIGSGFVVGGSGLANNDGQSRILRSHEEARKELEKILNEKK